MAGADGWEAQMIRGNMRSEIVAASTLDELREALARARAACRSDSAARSRRTWRGSTAGTRRTSCARAAAPEGSRRSHAKSGRAPLTAAAARTSGRRRPAGPTVAHRDKLVLTALVRGPARTISDVTSAP